MEKSINTSANTQDVAAPADTTVSEVENTGASANVADQPTEEQNRNSAFANVRRKAESDAQKKYEAARSKETERMNSYAKSKGYDSFDALEATERNQSLIDAGVQPESITGLIRDELSKSINDHPAVKAAEAFLIETEADKAMQDFVIAFPHEGIKSVTDFAKMPNYDAFYDYVAKGLPYTDAYMLVNRKALMEKETAAAKQQAINNIANKDHLKPQQGSGEGADGTVVPPETKAMYKSWFPNWSDDKIAKHYKESQKG